MATVGLVAGPTAAAPRSTTAGDQPDPLTATADLQVTVGAYVRDVIEVERIQGVVAGLQQAVGDVIAATVAAEARAAAARRVTPRPAPVAPAPTGGGSGACTGFAVPDYIIQRESGGNPNAVNSSSGAYGCAQIMPYVWSANCSDLSRDVAGQRECVNRLSNGGTNLSPWATTR